MSRNSAKSPSQRQLRVGEELRHAIAGVLERDEVRDPDVAGRSVTVTEVRVSPDLKNATAYVMPLGGDEVSTVIAGLNRAQAFFRREIGRRARLRHVPRVSFTQDSTFDQAGRINALLREPGVRQDLDRRSAAEPDDDA